jgi:quercetin dioxygenase-like cupin family protein
MTESMLVTIEGGRTVPMPDANLDIRSVLLQRNPQSRARTMIAEFPPGFDRPVPGHYAAGEEVLLLRGMLTVGTLDLCEGDWAWIPPGVLRAGFSTATGAVAFAWFSGGNDWIRGGDGLAGSRQEPVGWAADAVPRPLRSGGSADGPGSSAVVGRGTPVSGPAELVDLGTRCWRALDVADSVTVQSSTFVRWAN